MSSKSVDRRVVRDRDRRSWGILVRRRRRAQLLFHPPPGPPSSTTAFACGGLLTLTLRGKAMDGLEEQQERNRPHLFHRAWKTGETDAGFPRAPTGRTEPTIDASQTLATQATRPPNRGRRTGSPASAEPRAKARGAGWRPPCRATSPRALVRCIRLLCSALMSAVICD